MVVEYPFDNISWTTRLTNWVGAIVLLLTMDIDIDMTSYIYI